MKTMCLCMFTIALYFVAWSAGTAEDLLRNGDSVDVVAIEAHEETPTVLVTIGELRFVPALNQIEFDVTYHITGDESIHVWGYSPEHVFYDFEIRASEGEVWMPVGFFRCGTGLRLHELEPDASYESRQFIPGDYRASEIRVVLRYWKDPRDHTSASDAASTPRRVPVDENANDS